MKIVRKPRTKRSFWNLLSVKIVEEASHETIILEASCCQNCRKPRTKRSFWKLCSMTIVKEASHETIIFGSFFCDGVVLELRTKVVQSSTGVVPLVRSRIL